MVVLGHGTGNDRFYPLRQLIEDLIAAGFGVATSDLPGHGLWQQDVFRQEALREFWPATLATVAAQGFRSIIAIGHSLSAAMLAQHVAQQPPPPGPPVHSAILLSPPVEVTVSLKAIAYELWYSLGDGAMLREVGRYGPWGIVPALGSFKRAQFPVRVAEGQRYLDIVHEYLRSTKAHLSRANTAGAAAAASPVCLVLSGRQDLLAPPAAGQHYATELAGNHMVLEPCNHFTLPFKTEARQAIMSHCLAHIDRQKGSRHVRP